MKTIAVIPARGGSKRLPGKNIKMLCGKPMIAYAIEEAKKSRLIDNVFVTSDSDEILSIAKDYGVGIIKRPDELARDNTSAEDTIKHALKTVGYEAVIVYLPPTSPLRTVKDIDKCIQLYKQGYFNTVLTVKEIAPHTFYPNGAVYVFKDKIWSDSMGFVFMKSEDSIDVDTKLDFDMAEKILNDRNK